MTRGLPWTRRRPVWAADSQVGLAEAVATEAKAAVDRAAVNRDHTVITSPLDGIVVSRNVDVGQTVASTLQAPVLFTIAADLKRMQVATDIDEGDIGVVRVGESAPFEVESYPDETFQGRVSAVRLQPVVAQTTVAATAGASTAVPSTAPGGAVTTYTTIVDVANPKEKLRPGMTATVTLDGLRRDGAIRIPNAATAFRPPPEVMHVVGQAADSSALAAETTADASWRQVWRFDGSRFTPIKVQVGLADGEWTELVSGRLRPGDTLVTAASLEAGAAR